MERDPILWGGLVQGYGCREASRDLLLKGCGSGGADVRIDVNVPYRMKAWPRCSVNPGLWQWRIINAYPWKSSSQHINIYELKAAVNSLKWRCRRRGCVRKRIFQLLDSQVVLSVLAKGRTSSKLLRPWLKQWNALCLASNIYPILGFVNSEYNPSDFPSRKRHGKNRDEA